MKTALLHFPWFRAKKKFLILEISGSVILVTPFLIKHNNKIPLKEMPKHSKFSKFVHATFKKKTKLKSKI